MIFGLLRSLCLIAMLMYTAMLPCFAQVCADTGAYGGWSSGATGGDFYGGAGKTADQNLGLPQAGSSSPRNGIAPGNLALKQLGRPDLPPTRLSGFVKQGGDAVFGGDRPLCPFDENRDKGFTQEQHLENSMRNCTELTTNHRISSPSAWDFPQ